MLVFDTIVALATPPYKSALALIRLSGEKTLDILSHLIKRDVSLLQPNHSYFVKLYKDENKTEVIDEAVITFYKGPKSYTGFDSVDFSTHGSMFVVDELIEAIVKLGARRADRGEFSAQAYFNNKMDLLKAEGINDLINATSKRAKKIATMTLSGKNTTIITELKNKFLDYISKLEYFVENQYDDQENDSIEELNGIAHSINEDIVNLDSIIESTIKANKEYRGFTVAIVGEPNVGKSTLLNSLLKEDKAIVSPIPGTTRDVVEGEKEINGLLFRFKDTAGIRKSDDVIENLGIERSFETIKKADLILLASDTGFTEINNNIELKETIGDKPVIYIDTKRDLNPNTTGDISICSTIDDLSPLINMMLDKLNLNQKDEADFLGKREEEYLIKIRDQLVKTINAINDTYQIDIVSDTLRVAISLINDMMGKCENQTMEDIYQTLFSKFCLGK